MDHNNQLFHLGVTWGVCFPAWSQSWTLVLSLLKPRADRWGTVSLWRSRLCSNTRLDLSTVQWWKLQPFHRHRGFFFFRCSSVIQHQNRTTSLKRERSCFQRSSTSGGKSASVRRERFELCLYLYLGICAPVNMLHVVFYCAIIDDLNVFCKLSDKFQIFSLVSDHENTFQCLARR